VKHALIATGIDASRLSTQGLGATQPIADNTSDDGRFKNRRVEITRR
jgi:outer membrane protein OmpA-like peptidoglycan-associated protein